MQNLTPGQEMRQAGEDDSRRIIGPPGLDLALLQGQLSTQEQILGRELGT